MSTNEDPFEYIEDKLSLSFQKYLPKPLNHPNDPNKIIITTPSSEPNGGIFELDLISNQSRQLHQYDTDKIDTDEVATSHGHIIHPPSKTLFILDGSKSGYGAFNFETNEMEYEDPNELHKSNIAYYIEPLNELHGFDVWDNHHFIYKFEDDHMELIAKHQAIESKTNQDTFNLIYHAAKKRLLSFEECQPRITSNIWQLDLLNKAAEWTKMDSMKMAHKRNYEISYDVILGFDDIVFVFYFTKEFNFDIWCHHLCNDMLYKSQYKVPEIFADSFSRFVVKDGNNNAHIINYETGQHVKVDLFNLIPNELLKSHQKYYQPLIMGYLREKENENNMPCIPFALKTLILKFFPL